MARNLFLFIIFFLFISSSLSGQEIKRGYIDISGKGLLEETDVYLKGKWAFFPGKFKDPYRCNPFRAPHYIDAPGDWNSLAVDGEAFGGENIGTYAVRIKLPRGGDYYALKVPEMATSFELFVNGYRVAHNGIVGTSIATTVPSYRPLEVTFYAPWKYITLVFHIANYHHIKGGMKHPVIIGTPLQIRRRSLFRQFLEIFLLGSVFLIGFYQVFISRQVKRDTAAMYFAAFCFLISIRIPVIGEHLLVQAFPELPWMINVVIEYLTIPLGVILFTSFTALNFKHQFNRYAKPVLLYSSLALCIGILVMPGEVFMTALLYYQWIGAAGIVYLIFLMTVSLLKGEKNAAAFSIGSFFFLVSLVLEYLYSNQVLGNLYFSNATSVGLFVLMLSQARVLSGRNKESIDDSEYPVVEFQQKAEEESEGRIVDLDKIHDNMEFARMVQAASLPEALPAGEGYRSAALCLPAEMPGGDFYNFHIFRDGTVGVFIADVAGHGIAPALTASMVNSFFSFCRESGREPRRLLEEMNSMLIKKMEGHYFSAAYGYIDFKNQSMKYARGGHEPLVIFNRHENSIRSLQPRGSILGFEKNIEVQEVDLELHEGDRIIFYSDMVIKAENERHEIFGMERFYRLIKEDRDAEGTALTARIAESLRLWTGSTGYLEDDLTLVVIDID